MKGHELGKQTTAASRRGRRARPHGRSRRPAQCSRPPASRPAMSNGRRAPVAAVLARHQRREPQRRGQADGGAAQAGRRRSVAVASTTIPTPTSWSCGARARSICRSPIDRLQLKYNLAGQVAPADASTTRRRSAAAPSSTPASSGRAAATASSATCMSRSSRCRAAPASSSRTRSSAASCRAIHPVGRGGGARLSAARAAGLPGGRRRGDARSTASTTPSTAPTWRSRRRRAWP